MVSTNFFSLSLSWHCWHSSELTGSNHFLEKQEHTIMILTNNLSVSRKKCDQKSTEVSVCYISRYNLFDACMFVDIVRWVKSKWNAHLHIFACQVVCEVDTLAWALSHVRSSCQIFRLLWIPNSLSVLHTETIKTVRCESESLTCNITAEIKSGERKFELWLWSNGCRFHYLCHSLFKLFFGSIKSLGADLGSTWYCIQHFLVFYLKNL